jgi:hypothetical protein
MVETKYYTIAEGSDYVDDNGYPRSENDGLKVYAKAVKETKKKNILDRSPSYFKYYVRIEPNRSLHDPYGGHSVKTDSRSFVDRICKIENTFMEVNHSVFDKYINYLKTQNNKWLTDARREIK